MMFQFLIAAALGAAGLPVCGDDPQCYNAGLGYSVTSLGDCTALMLAHELGHNLGSAHEPGLDWPGTYPYAHAHVTPGGVGTEGVAVVDFATEDGTARAGTPYMPSRGSFAWPDGADRTFSVRLSSPSAGASLGSPAVAVVTITAQGGGGGLLSPASPLSQPPPALPFRRAGRTGRSSPRPVRGGNPRSRRLRASAAVAPRPRDASGR